MHHENEHRHKNTLVRYYVCGFLLLFTTVRWVELSVFGQTPHTLFNQWILKAKNDDSFVHLMFIVKTYRFETILHWVHCWLCRRHCRCRTFEAITKNHTQMRARKIDNRQFTFLSMFHEATIYMYACVTVSSPNWTFTIAFCINKLLLIIWYPTWQQYCWYVGHIYGNT